MEQHGALDCFLLYVPLDNEVVFGCSEVALLHQEECSLPLHCVQEVVHYLIRESNTQKYFLTTLNLNVCSHFTSRHA